MVKNKKGTIDLSLQTIIIVVLGVTLLGLGLMFVTKMMGNEGLGVISEGIFTVADDQINQYFGGSEDLFYLSNQNLKVEQGKDDTLDVYVRNIGSSDNVKFAFEVNTINAPGNLDDISDWFAWNKEGKELNSGKAYMQKLLVRVPNNAKLGTYMISLEMVTCGDPEICDPLPEIEFTLEVTS